MSEVVDLRTLIERNPRLRRPAPPREPPVLKPRLTVLETVYCQAPGEEATAFENRFGRFLDTTQQPCVRRLEVGEEWMALDGVWLTAAGQLAVRNDEGQFRGGQPTEQQRADVAAKVVEVGMEVGAAIVPFAHVAPGESCRFAPASLTSLRLRCRKGQARVTAAVFPE